MLLMQYLNDWVCRQCKNSGHRQDDFQEDFSSNHEDVNNEQSGANDAETKDNEVSQYIPQPFTSMA